MCPMRCFLAIELSEPARAHLLGAQAMLRDLLPKLSIPRAENLHVTLKFLGDADDRQLDAVYESLRHVQVDGRLELAASAMSAFPQRGAARVLVASMAGSEAVVAALHNAVEQRCRRLGFTSEQRRYHPHVTLARCARGVPPEQQRALVERVQGHWPGPTFVVARFVLFHSQRHPEGSRYIKLATFPLSAAPVE